MAVAEEMIKGPTARRDRMPDVAALHVEYARTRDPRLMRELVLAHAGLAQSVARRFGARGRESIDDVAQVAYLALIQAVQRFEPERGYQFSTYATKVIVGSLKRHLRDHGWAVRPSRRVHDRYLELQTALDELTQELGRSPTAEELAERLGASVEDVIEAQEAGSRRWITSLDAPTNADGSVNRADALGQLDERAQEFEDRAHVAAVVRQLPAEDQRIVRLRFIEGLSQRQIAELLGTSQMQVSRRLRAALERARVLLEM